MKAFDRWRSRGAQPPDTRPTAMPESAPEVVSARLGTVHDTVLAVKKGRLDQARRSGDPVRMVWEPGSGLALLVTDTMDTEFSLGAATPRAMAHLVRCEQLTPTSVALVDPWTRTWLSPAPVDGPPQPRMRAGRTARGDEEVLTLAPDDAAFPALGTATEVYVRLRRFRQVGAGAQDAVDVLSDPADHLARALFSGLLPMLSRSEVVSVARAVVASDELTSRLAHLFPTDPWYTRSLPGLRTWLVDRDRQSVHWTKQKVGTDLDVLWPAGVGDVAASSGEVLAFYARSEVRPRRRVCVVATARNEGVYLLEWLAYYRALGVDEFFVYSNNNEDGSDRLLEALADAGAIRWLDSTVGSGTKAQAKAYAHAYSVLPDVLDFEWSMTIDIDEFLVLDPATSTGLGDFLDWHAHRQSDVVAVNWVVVTPSGYTRWTDDLVTRKFAAKEAPVSDHIKSVSRPTRILGSQPHFPYTTEREHLAFRESDGSPHTWHGSTLEPHLVKAQSDRPVTSPAALHHYALKSAEEFLWKFSRNRGGRITATGDDGMALTLEERFARRFLGQFDKNAGDARPATTITVPDLDAEIEALRRLDGVREAEDHVRAAFAERLALVVAAYRPKLRDELGEPGRRLLQLLADDPEPSNGDTDVDHAS